MVKSKKAISTQVIFFIAMSLIMIGIIIFGLQKINDISSTISAQEEIEIKSELEDAFLFCSDPINSGSFKIIDLAQREYNSICFNCYNTLSIENTYNINLLQSFEDEALILKDAGVNFLLLKTVFNSGSLIEYDIVGQLSIEELGFEISRAWFDLENSQELEIKIKCE